MLLPVDFYSPSSQNQGKIPPKSKKRFDYFPQRREIKFESIYHQIILELQAKMPH